MKWGDDHLCGPAPTMLGIISRKFGYFPTGIPFYASGE